MSNHDDAIFVRNFSLVLVGLVIVGILAFVLAKIVSRGYEETVDTSPGAAARVAPMGQVNTGGEAVDLAGTSSAPASHADEAAAEPAAAAAPASGDIGKSTYDKVCFACHAQGIAGAPKQGDMAAWEARIAKGKDALYQNAINGYTGDGGLMPAKGGNPMLSDDEVKAAVDHMLDAVGAGGSASAEPAPAAAPADAAAEAPAAAVADAGGRGKEVYDAACFVCHTPGAAGAPKHGDKAAWAPRIEKGMDALYHSSINGFMGDAGMMPPKGGRPDFSDDDVKAAVDYMVEAGQ